MWFHRFGKCLANILAYEKVERFPFFYGSSARFQILAKRVIQMRGKTTFWESERKKGSRSEAAKEVRAEWNY